MAVVRINEKVNVRYYQVKSTDTKPTDGVPAGARLLEVDTGRRFEYSYGNTNPATSDGWWEKLEERLGWGVYQGLAVTEQSTPDMTVNVDDGYVYLPSGKRFAVAGNSALAIDAADATYNRKDLIYVDANGLLQYIAGGIAVAGERDYVLATNLVVGDTVAFFSQTITCVAADPSTDEIVPGEDAATTALLLIAALNANATIGATFIALTTGDGTFTITELSPGGGDTPGAMVVTGTGEVTYGDATTSDAGDALPATPTGGTTIANLNVDQGTAAMETALITKTRAWTAGGVND